jgi:putative peptide zinc metalloprotease protein
MATTAAQVAESTPAATPLVRPVQSGEAAFPSIDLTHYRPALGREVALLGEMQGSGFASSMWLVQLEGRFVQLTELLYRVAEQCDGNRTLAQVAERISATTEWTMNASDAQFLVVQKLVPTGIVLAPGIVVDDDRARASAPSLLSLGHRRGVISAGAIEPLAKRLQWLFLPALLIPLVTLGLVAHAWLYFDHGIDGVFSSVLSTPGLLLVVFVMTLLPGFWHEFGHASALRYGGGRARSIGVGIYIMDPAFYTDVTDSYRLSRWGRVRTGLGGIYFDFILSTLLIGAYLWTGHQVLLLLVILSNINTAYQFFPLVRLDGYWVLADLTGVPDFYSMMGAFVRSVVPIKAWKGPKLPPLRPWVKGVFAVYTLIGFPAMLVFMVILLKRVPGIYEMTWHSLRDSLRGIPDAWRAADWLLVAANLSQVAFLAVTMLGLAWFLLMLTRTFLMLGIVLSRRLRRRERPATQAA